MLAVAVKPAGILSQPDRTGEDSMVTLLKAQLGREVFPVHRLDRAVGGLMIFAMTKKTVKPDMYALSSVIFLTVLVLLLIVNISQIRQEKKDQ